MSLNITILAECWDAIVQLASEHDKNDLWKSLRRAATRGNTGWYWTCRAVGEGPDRWREFQLEVAGADGNEVHCIMRTAVVDWSSSMETQGDDGGHLPSVDMLAVEEPHEQQN